MTSLKADSLSKLATYSIHPMVKTLKEEASHYHMVDGLPWRLPFLWLNSSFQAPGASFFRYLIQRFKVIQRLKLEPVVINVALVFHIPTLDCELSFLAADGVTSTLLMTNRTSKVSVQTRNF